MAELAAALGDQLTAALALEAVDRVALLVGKEIVFEEVRLQHRVREPRFLVCGAGGRLLARVAFRAILGEDDFALLEH